MSLYHVHFYKDRNGHEPVKEYLEELAAKKDKNSRIKLNKIRDYIKILVNMEHAPANRTRSTLRAIFGSCVHCRTAFYLSRG